jgi:hypothetical protein
LTAEELALTRVIEDDDSEANIEAWEWVYDRIAETLTLAPTASGAS